MREPDCEKVAACDGLRDERATCCLQKNQSKKFLRDTNNFEKFLEDRVKPENNYIEK